MSTAAGRCERFLMRVYLGGGGLYSSDTRVSAFERREMSTAAGRSERFRMSTEAWVRVWISQSPRLSRSGVTWDEVGAEKGGWERCGREAWRDGWRGGKREKWRGGWREEERWGERGRNGCAGEASGEAVGGGRSWEGVRVEVWAERGDGSRRC